MDNTSSTTTSTSSSTCTAGVKKRFKVLDVEKLRSQMNDDVMKQRGLLAKNMSNSPSSFNILKHSLKDDVHAIHQATKMNLPSSFDGE